MIQLSIQYDEKTGRIDLTGPIKNKILCYGLLGLAHDTLASFTPEKEKLIKIANAGIAEAIKQNGDRG